MKPPSKGHQVSIPILMGNLSMGKGEGPGLGEGLGLAVQ